jgi:hypothetical protein
MKKRRFLITGGDEASKNGLARTLHSGFSSEGLKVAVIQLDGDHPIEGNKAIGFKYSLDTDVIILVGGLDTPKDVARYKRLARVDAEVRCEHLVIKSLG